MGLLALSFASIPHFASPPRILYHSAFFLSLNSSHLSFLRVSVFFTSQFSTPPSIQLLGPWGLRPSPSLLLPISLAHFPSPPYLTWLGNTLLITHQLHHRHCRSVRPRRHRGDAAPRLSGARLEGGSSSATFQHCRSVRPCQLMVGGAAPWLSGS